MKQLVSILIPCYNSEEFLKVCIESCLSQTWTRKEIIIVDDGSSDHSLEVAKKFTSSSVKIISQKHSNANVARNRALKEASGDYIQYLDADDLLDSQKIELQMNLFKEGNCKDCVASGEWARFDESINEAIFNKELLWGDFNAIDFLIIAWKKHSMMPTAAWLTPRSIIMQAGPWDESLLINQDGEYFTRVCLASNGIKFSKGSRSYYRSHGSGTSSLKGKKVFESLFMSYQLSEKHIRLKEDSERVKQACADRYQRFIYDVYPAVPALRESAKRKVLEFGGSDLNPEGGPRLLFLQRLIGWKLARVLKHYFSYKLRRYLEWDVQKND